ncbi:MAG: radical SAM family heme chaperone HemW [Rickettsiales bacterium]|jgi:oxygen-independent coproporphyrinogen-3 oxidase|nr:radical SAM family heme chaperone HemW [Rickettsiales bacterium]
MREKLSLYVHYPFCRAKCPYCDFNSYPSGSFGDCDLLEAYLRELSYYSEILAPRTLSTIFFGGGTPSLMSLESMEAILSKIGELFSLDDDLEVTLEANPTTLEIDKFKAFRSLGIGRLSIGIQSLEDQHLEFLGRTYGRREALEAIEVAQSCFGDSYSIDLIYARPEQTLGQWLEELEEALELSPRHLSLYQLTLEPGTEFFRRGIRALDGDRAAEMYQVTNEFMESRGIPLYEISNYAKGGSRCRHNLNYWNSGEWLALGAGAQSRLCLGDEFVGGYRERIALENIKNPLHWRGQVLTSGHGLRTSEKLTREEFIDEALLMGLRLRDGVAMENLEKYLRLDSGSLLELLEGDWRYLAAENYIEVSDRNIRIPLENLRILDSIVGRIT